MNDSTASTIARFWLGPSEEGAETAEAQRARWYRGGPSLDTEIVERFSAPVEAALTGRLTSWGADPVGALALVILLDQFTRTIYRGTPQAYAGDALAMEVADAAIASGLDRALSLPGRLFLYHPYHHAETVAEQNRGVELLEAMRDEAAAEWREWTERRVAGFASHRDIVARFGRFPHRNQVLERTSTEAELAFLAADPNSYGQEGGGAAKASPRAQS